MQKHNRYLVWTIWVATIAFIGAGFVGWGSYQFGSKASSVAKVGEIEIKKAKLDMVYSNIYNQYNQMMQGKLDEKRAKELGLVKQAFSTLVTQAKILNFAKEMGIVASDKEVANRLQAIKAFQKDGIFNREIYEGYLKNQRVKAKVFEATLREEITIDKTLALLETESLPLEKEAVFAAMNVADKIAYRVLTLSDINITEDEAEVKKYWETHKDNYITDKKYELDIVWTQSTTTPVTEKELEAYYQSHSFNYTDAEGKQLPFDIAKERVSRDLKLKKTKKSAQKSYIAFKKGELKSSERVTLPIDDSTLTPELWSEIREKAEGDILKPKIVADRYATVKIIQIIEPKVMHFEEAKEKVTKEYRLHAQKEGLLRLANATLKNFDETNTTVSDFITLEKHDNLKSLNSQESVQFLQKLFTSSEEKGTIHIPNKIIVYTIIDQKLLPMDENRTNLIKNSVDQIKKRVFETNLLKLLDKRYSTEVYIGGVTN